MVKEGYENLSFSDGIEAEKVRIKDKSIEKAGTLKYIWIVVCLLNK